MNLENIERLESRHGASVVDAAQPQAQQSSEAIITPDANKITLLTRNGKCDLAKPYAKVWSNNESGKSITCAYKNNVTERTIATLDDAFNLLTELSTKPFTCVVSGALNSYGVELTKSGKPVRRLIHDHNGIDGRATFSDAPRSYLVLDIDAKTTPFNITTDPEKAIAHFIENSLPVEFKNVGYVWKLSGSAGHHAKSVYELRVHLWFMLTESRTNAQKKAWSQKHLAQGTVDSAVFNPVQPIFTANPILNFCTLNDPCKQRLGIVRGNPLFMPIVSTVDLSRINTHKQKRELSTKTQQAIKSANVLGAFATKFQKNVAFYALGNAVNDLKNAGTGTRHNTLNRVLYYLYGYVHSGALDERLMIDKLQSAALSIGITYERFLENVKRKQTDYAPLDDSLLSDFDDIPEIITKSDKPLVIDPNAIRAAFEQLDEYPKHFKDCLTTIQETTDPDKIVSLTAHTVNMLIHNAPFKYVFKECIEQLKSVLGDAIHPLTFAACVKWGQQTGDYIKAKSLKGVTISDDVKARHHYKQINKIADAIPLNTARLIVVRVAMGEGKTKVLGQGLRNLAAHQNKRFAALTHRAALVEELCNVLNLTPYNKVQERLDEKGATPEKVYRYLGSCVHSIASPFVRTAFDSCDTLFIDEAAQLLRSLVSIYNKETSTAMNTEAQDVYDLLVKTIQTAPKVVLCDAGANDELIEWLESILGNEKMLIVETPKRSGDGITVNYHFANQQLRGEQAAITAIKERLQQGRKVWVSVGTVKTGKMLEQALKGHGKGFFIHSKTPTTERTRFLKNVDSESLNYDYVIASPVISCGISITHQNTPHFNDVFYIGDGSSVTPQDVLQMIRRVRYVQDVHIYSWLPYQQRMGDTRRERQISDFYTLKTHLTASQNWERQNYNIALCHTLESTGFTVIYKAVDGHHGDIKQAIEQYKELKQQRVLELNSADVLSVSAYESLKTCRSLTQPQVNAIDAFELREHLGKRDSIDEEDVSIWKEGRGRELLARRGACRGVALPDVEHSPVLVDLYGRIFEGVDIANLEQLTPQIAETICKNAISVGRVGVQYELLPQSYARAKRAVKNFMKSAMVILRQCGFEVGGIVRPESPFCLSKSGNSGHKKERERITLLDRDLINKLDAITDRKTFEADVLNCPLITQPLPDKVQKREAIPFKPKKAEQYDDTWLNEWLNEEREILWRDRKTG